MIESDIARQICFAIVASVFGLIAIRAFLNPDKLAEELGYRLEAPNGYSELFAIYIGVWLATAILALTALWHVNVVIFGDLLALFVIAQPAGRLLAIPRWGMPRKGLLVMFGVEVAGGMILVIVRPFS